MKHSHSVYEILFPQLLNFHIQNDFDLQLGLTYCLDVSGYGPHGNTFLGMR